MIIFYEEKGRYSYSFVQAKLSAGTIFLEKNQSNERRRLGDNIQNE